jgi:hypothetical protein
MDIKKTLKNKGEKESKLGRKYLEDFADIVVSKDLPLLEFMPKKINIYSTNPDYENDSHIFKDLLEHRLEEQYGNESGYSGPKVILSEEQSHNGDFSIYLDYFFDKKKLPSIVPNYRHLDKIKDYSVKYGKRV